MDNKVIIGVLGLAGLAYLASKAGATTQPPIPPTAEGTLDIISCQDVQATQGSSVLVPIVVKALNGDVISKPLKIIAGSYTDIKNITLGVNQTTTVTFTVPNITQDTQYLVSIV